jgi:DNA-binding transcriptional LysR family regulator
LLQNEIDLAVTLIEKKAPATFHTLTLLELPMVLLVEKNSSITTAHQLWQRDRIQEQLICLPPGEALTKSFLQRLSELDVDWFPSIEASSVDLVEIFVTRGLGIGMSVQVPNKPLSPGVRAIPLPDFPPAIIGAMWRGRTTPLLQAFLDEIKFRARQIASS